MKSVFGLVLPASALYFSVIPIATAVESLRQPDNFLYKQAS